MSHKLSTSEQDELLDLCKVWNNLHGNDEYIDKPGQPYPFDRISELSLKSGIPVMLRVKDGIKIIGWTR